MTPDPQKQLFDEALGTAPARGRLDGRRVLVVGAGTRKDEQERTGNGRAAALLFAREGAAVACADIDAGAAGDTVAMIRQGGGEAVAVTADVGSPEDAARMVEEAHAGLGGLDGILLNVGISGTPDGLAGQTPETWDRSFAVNVRGHMLVCKHAFPVLEAGSSIIFISSAAALRPGGNKPDYDASKAALFGLMRHVAMEGEPLGIRANVLAFGMVNTPMGAAATKANPGRARRWVPFGRQATVWESAYTALFLMSRESSYVNGHVMVMDGGRTSIRNT